MQTISYNRNQSSFYQQIAEAVRASEGLSRPLEIALGKRGGYVRDVEIEIGDDPHSFRSTWRGSGETVLGTASGCGHGTAGSRDPRTLPRCPS
jgi:hypothetical protein